MRDYRINSPEDLDAALTAHEISRREKLMRQAAGETSGWTEVISVLIGMACAFAGFYGLIVEEELVAVVAIVMGLNIVAMTYYRRQQRQIEALSKLLAERRGPL